MNIIDSLIKKINQAEEIFVPALPEGEVVDQLIARGESVREAIKKSETLKVPFVGDFNAGKSSLVNAFLGIDLLPTDITPETAVSYELYYDSKEHIVILHEDNSMQEKPLSEINNQNLSPSDLVKVYVDNEKIRALNERGIVIVDMPGIDSGIEAHNNAILRYIKEGTVFVLVTDADQATLRSSSISFIRELKQYGLKMFVVINKADKKPEDEIQTAILPHITEQANRYIGEDTFVGVTSAILGNITHISEIFDKIDVENTIKANCKPIVNGLISDAISAINVRIGVVNTDKGQYAEKIQNLKAKREEVLCKLKERDRNAQSVDASAEDILSDVRNALQAQSLSLAQNLFHSGNNVEQFNAEVMNVIRPVLVNSFKRELAEYSTVISEAVHDFSIDVDNILRDKESRTLESWKEATSKLFDEKTVENVMTDGINKLITRFQDKKGISTILRVAASFIGPLTAIIVNIIPDILSLFFGKSRESKIDEIRMKLSSCAFGRIIEGLRPEVIKMLTNQRNDTMSNAESVVNEEVKNIDLAIAQAEEEQEKNEMERKQETDRLVEAVKKMQSVIIQ